MLSPQANCPKCNKTKARLENLVGFNSAEKKASVKEKQGENKEYRYTPFLPESKCALSMRGLAQLVDEKSN